MNVDERREKDIAIFRSVAAKVNRNIEAEPWSETPADQMRPMHANIELTTRCPLRCPQCYCELSGGKDVDIAVARRFIEDAGRMKMFSVNLSGGETLLYPHLMELIRCCRANGLMASVALSGYGFSPEVLQQMIDADVTGIFISLNGSTEKINRVSRDGYDLAVKSLEILQSSSFREYWINWVAHSSNTADFPDLLELAGLYKARGVVVISFKPDSQQSLPSLPSREQFFGLAEYIREHQDDRVRIVVESCFSQLKAVLGERFFGNINQGVFNGCLAGRRSISLNVDGELTPCRHMEYREPYTSIAEYWNGSPVLARLREIEEDTRQPCRECCYEPYCLHCMAINAVMKGELFRGNEFCELLNVHESG